MYNYGMRVWLQAQQRDWKKSTNVIWPVKPCKILRVIWDQNSTSWLE